MRVSSNFQIFECLVGVIHTHIMIDDNKENVGPTLHNFRLTTSIQNLPKDETNNIYAMFKEHDAWRKIT